MAENTNIYGKKVGEHATLDDYNQRYSNVYDKWNQFGDTSLGWSEQGNFGVHSSDFNNFDDYKLVKDVERGTLSASALPQHLQQWYADRGADISTFNPAAEYQTLDDYNNKYSSVYDKWNQYGSDQFGWQDGSFSLKNTDFDSYDDYKLIKAVEQGNLSASALPAHLQQWYTDKGVDITSFNPGAEHQTWDSYVGRYSDVYDKWNQHGSELGWTPDEYGTGRFGVHSSTFDSHDDFSLVKAFERGELQWGGLPQNLKDWYLENYDPAQIIAGTDGTTGATITVADIINPVIAPIETNIPVVDETEELSYVPVEGQHNVQQVVSTPKEEIVTPVVQEDPVVAAPVEGPTPVNSATEVTTPTLRQRSFDPNETSRVYGYNPNADRNRFQQFDLDAFYDKYFANQPTTSAAQGWDPTNAFGVVDEVESVEDDIATAGGSGGGRTSFSVVPAAIQQAAAAAATDPTNPNYSNRFTDAFDYWSDDAASNPTGQTTGSGITPAIIAATGANVWLPTTSLDSGGGSSDSNGRGCVIATHAMGQGIDINRKEAIRWCIKNLHGSWYGEAVRKGYRHLGRKKIEAGKASEHYSEFKGYVDYATGKDKSIKNAMTFYGRTIQFFFVGLLVEE